MSYHGNGHSDFFLCFFPSTIMLESVNSLLRGDHVFVSFGAGSFFSVPTILLSIMDKKLSSLRLVALVDIVYYILHPIPEGLLVSATRNISFTRTS